jgi:hypothetical protein
VAILPRIARGGHGASLYARILTAFPASNERSIDALTRSKATARKYRWPIDDHPPVRSSSVWDLDSNVK